MTEAQQLGIHARDICSLLNVDPTLIKSIVLEPRSVTFTLYETNDSGRKFVASNGQAAMRSITRQLDWPS